LAVKVNSKPKTGIFVFHIDVSIFVCVRLKLSICAQIGLLMPVQIASN